MKYNLDEKFRLNEKFILNETFKIPSDIITNLNKITNSLESYNKENFKPVIKNISDLITELKTPQSKFNKLLSLQKEADNEIKLKRPADVTEAAVSKYLDELEKVVPNIDDGAKFDPKVADLVTKLKNRISVDYSTSKNKDDYEKWEKQAKEVNTLYSQLKKELKTKLLAKESEVSTENLEILLKNLKTFQTEVLDKLILLINANDLGIKTNLQKLEQVLIDLEENKINISTLEQIPTTISSNLAEIKLPASIIPQDYENNATKIKELSTNINYISQTVMDKLVEIDENLDKTLKKANEFKNQQKSHTDIDEKAAIWEEKYNNVKTHDDYVKFWDEYYDSWGSNADQIKNLKNTFVQQIDVLGFNPEDNPFLAFLNLNFNKENNNIPSNIKLSFDSYNGVHNSYIRKYINKNDLNGVRIPTGKANKPHKVNLLFNKNLFTKDMSTVIDYLELQAFVFKKFSNQSTLNFTNSTLSDIYKNEWWQFLINLFTENNSVIRGSLINASDETQAGKLLLNLKLKPVKDVKKELEKCFDNIKLTNPWRSAAADDLVSTLKTKEEGIRLLQYISSKYDNLVKNPDAIINKINSYKEVTNDKITTDISKYKLYKNLLSNYDINASNILTVIDDIAKSFNLTPVKKEETN